MTCLVAFLFPGLFFLAATGAGFFAEALLVTARWIFFFGEAFFAAALRATPAFAFLATLAFVAFFFKGDFFEPVAAVLPPSFRARFRSLW